MSNQKEFHAFENFPLSQLSPLYVMRKHKNICQHWNLSCLSVHLKVLGINLKVDGTALKRGKIRKIWGHAP